MGVDSSVRCSPSKALADSPHFQAAVHINAVWLRRGAFKTLPKVELALRAHNHGIPALHVLQVTRQQRSYRILIACGTPWSEKHSRQFARMQPEVRKYCSIRWSRSSDNSPFALIGPARVLCVLVFGQQLDQ